MISKSSSSPTLLFRSFIPSGVLKFRMPWSGSLSHWPRMVYWTSLFWMRSWRVTVVPKLTREGLTLSGVMTWAFSISSLSVLRRALRFFCLSVPYWYSAFSLRSPRARASAISLATAWSSTCSMCSYSLIFSSRAFFVHRKPMGMSSSSRIWTGLSSKKVKSGYFSLMKCLTSMTWPGSMFLSLATIE